MFWRLEAGGGADFAATLCHYFDSACSADARHLYLSQSIKTYWHGKRVILNIYAFKNREDIIYEKRSSWDRRIPKEEGRGHVTAQMPGRYDVRSRRQVLPLVPVPRADNLDTSCQRVMALPLRAGMLIADIAGGWPVGAARARAVCRRKLLMRYAQEGRASADSPRRPPYAWRRVAYRGFHRSASLFGRCARRAARPYADGHCARRARRFVLIRPRTPVAKRNFITTMHRGLPV